MAEKQCIINYIIWYYIGKLMDNLLKLKYINHVRNGDLVEMKKMIAEGMPMDCFSNGALLEACYCGHINIVAYLVESKIDINKNNGLELMVAFKQKRINIAEYLLRKGIIEKYTPSIINEDKPIGKMVDYLINDENYIKYAFTKDDRAIITWCENYMKKQRIINAFVEVKEDGLDKDMKTTSKKFR